MWQKKKTGRKSKLSDTIKLDITHSIRPEEVNNAVYVKNRLKAFNNTEISAERVRRMLRQADINGRDKVKKLFLTKRHMKLHLKFAKQYNNISIEDLKYIIHF